ncbi:MAG: WYL domain-containing protein [Paludibacteraceae bacterium]|nr:WYL domain-containing protein [Paludibacteraceae bacterium]
MNPSLSVKIAWLYELLNGSAGMTLEDIQNAYSRAKDISDGRTLSDRTFHYWKNHISKLYGAEVKSKRLGPGYYLYSIEHEDEPVSKWLCDTMAMQNAISGNIIIRDRILLEDVPNSKFLNPVLQAIKNCHVIEFTYNDYWDEEEHLLIKPLFVKMFRQRWHVIGPLYNPDAKPQRMVLRLPPSESDTIRSYAIDDRMKELKVTNIEFAYPELFDPKDYFSNNFSTLKFPESHLKTEFIRILVWENKNFYYRSVPIHPSQKEIYTSPTDGFSIFEYYLQPTIDFIQELRSHGNEIEVLSPKWLREQFISDINDMAKAYQGFDRSTLKTPLPPCIAELMDL